MSDKNSIGRETSIFAVAFISSMSMNLLVRSKLAKQYGIVGIEENYEGTVAMEKQLKECLRKGRARGGDRSEQEDISARCMVNKVLNTSRGTGLATALGWNSTVGFLVVGAPLGATYYSWDYALYKDSEWYDTTEAKIIPTVTFAVLMWIFHSVISSVGRAKYISEAALYSSIFALLASGTSALMHEFYPKK